jgi:hypothetical protein
VLDGDDRPDESAGADAVDGERRAPGQGADAEAGAEPADGADGEGGADPWLSRAATSVRAVVERVVMVTGISSVGAGRLPG